MEQKQRMLAAQYRLAQHYLDKLCMAQRTYQQGNENIAHALTMFDREREQVKQWQAWTANHASKDEQAAVLCSDYAKASPDIFHLRLLHQEYFSWLQAALEAARLLKNRRAEVAHLLELCAIGNHILEYHLCLDYAQQALALAQQLHDRSLLAQALSCCGVASRNQENFKVAQEYFEQSLSLYRAIGDQKSMASVLSHLSVLALSRRNNVEAQDYLEQSLALFREIGDQEGLSICLNNLGFLAIRSGNFVIACDYLEQFLALCRMTGNNTGIAIGLTNLGTIAYYQEEYALARRHLEEGLAAARISGARDRETICLHKLGRVAMVQGNLREAQHYFEQSLAFSRTTTTSTLLPETLSNLAITYLLHHQENLANATLHEALEIVNTLSVIHAVLLALVAVARVWILKGKPVQAATWLGLVEHYPDPAVQMTDMQRDLRIARTECLAEISPEQFTAAWEEGKTLELDAEIVEILHELG